MSDKYVVLLTREGCDLFKFYFDTRENAQDFLKDISPFMAPETSASIEGVMDGVAN